MYLIPYVVPIWEIMSSNSDMSFSVFYFISFLVPIEEILSSNSAMWFSPHGGRLVFATFNDSLVDTMNFPLYGQPGELPFQYPFQQSIKYPKVNILAIESLVQRVNKKIQFKLLAIATLHAV